MNFCGTIDEQCQSMTVFRPALMTCCHGVAVALMGHVWDEISRKVYIPVRPVKEMTQRSIRQSVINNIKGIF